MTNWHPSGLGAGWPNLSQHQKPLNMNGGNQYQTPTSGVKNDGLGMDGPLSYYNPSKAGTEGYSGTSQVGNSGYTATQGLGLENIYGGVPKMYPEGDPGYTATQGLGFENMYGEVSKMFPEGDPSYTATKDTGIFETLAWVAELIKMPVDQPIPEMPKECYGKLHSC